MSSSGTSAPGAPAPGSRRAARAGDRRAGLLLSTSVVLTLGAVAGGLGGAFSGRVLLGALAGGLTAICVYLAAVLALVAMSSRGRPSGRHPSGRRRAANRPR